MTWHPITCAESDALHAAHDLSVAVGFTDMEGEYGDPEIRREWADKATGELVVKDVRWPPLTPDVDGYAHRPCEHYAFQSESQPAQEN
jgi:hypothetical protein